MTLEKLEFILARQTPDDEKRARADYVIDTSCDLETTARQVERIIAELKSTGQAE
jgi:dephospho-CoA kinase